MPSQPDFLTRTADRRRSTGESHHALIPLLPVDGGVLPIPPARHFSAGTSRVDDRLAVSALVSGN